MKIHTKECKNEMTCGCFKIDQQKKRVDGKEKVYQNFNNY